MTEARATTHPVFGKKRKRGHKVKAYRREEIPIFTEWTGCYDSGWQWEIIPDAFSHPAKFSRGLIRRIYDHALAEGWLEPGDTVADPFGGVALGALDAMWDGLNWVGVELEPKFVTLGQQNLALWQRKYGSKEAFGTARIIQGDSRRLAEIVGAADLICSSPPFLECGTGADKEAHNRQVITSGVPTHRKNAVIGKTDYAGSSPGQLASMPEGRFEAVVRINLDTERDSDRMSLCKPVKIAERLLLDRASDVGGAHIDMSAKSLRGAKNHWDMASMLRQRDAESQCRIIGDKPIISGTAEEIAGEGTHGEPVVQPLFNEITINADVVELLNDSKSTTEKTLMRQKEFGTTQLKISKPSAPSVILPTTGKKSLTPSVRSAIKSTEQDQLGLVVQKNADMKLSGEQVSDSIGNQPKPIPVMSVIGSSDLREDDGNIAQENACEKRELKKRRDEEADFESETFWASAKIIVQQCHAILKPNGHAIFVCKDVVRKGKRVPFSDQWQALCESVGFRLICRHRAMLVAHHGEQETIWEGTEQLKTERKSFFRRLCEAKGSPKIDWEDVLCFVRES